MGELERKRKRRGGRFVKDQISDVLTKGRMSGATDDGASTIINL